MPLAPESCPLWVTGVGLVTPLGTGVDATWARLVRGERAIRPVRLFATEGQRASVAGEVDGVTVEGDAWSRTSAMALDAAAEAMRGARLRPGETRGARVGLVIGSTTGGMFETEQLLATLHARPESHEVLAAMLSHPLTSTGDRLAERLGPFARVRTLSSACSSGANALLVAAAWLLEGELDAVVAGGSDGLCRLTLSGFNALSALDVEPCRPFDVRRKGTSLGEGAGFVVIERADAARARGATAIAELAGWAAGSEAHHITQPATDGAVVAALVTQALARAGVAPADVDYVNAHGTGTSANDATEVAALRQALGGEMDRIPVSSSKAQIGHTLGAAGAIEAAITALVVERRVLVPTAGLSEPDPEARVVHVRQATEVARVRAAVSCSFGFGGMDAVLVFVPPSREARPATPPAREVVVTGVAVVGGGGVFEGQACAAIPALPPDAKSQADDGHAAPIDTDPYLDPVRARRLDVTARLATVAVERALSVARVEDRAAAGLVLGSAFGSVDGSAAFMHRIFERGPRSAIPAEFPNLVPSGPVGHASIYLGLRGPAFATADLSASGESAFAQAAQLVAVGEADLIVAGAVEPRSGIVERVLAALFAPTGASGPRNEVAAALVIEAAAVARARGARSLARVRSIVEWRGEPGDAVDRLVPPATPGAEVVLPRDSGDSGEAAPCEGWRAAIAGTKWAACPRVVCATALGESDGLGGAALAVAAARVAAGRASEALVVGLAPGRGFYIVLAAPGQAATAGDARSAS